MTVNFQVGFLLCFFLATLPKVISVYEFSSALKDLKWGTKASALLERMVEMEKQHQVPTTVQKVVWKRHEKANDDEWHEMTFVVNQKNIDYLKKRIEKTSDLDSHMYGKHLSFEEVGELVRNDEATSVVRSWLESNGAVTTTTEFGEYIYAGAPVNTWRALLDAKFFRYRPTHMHGIDSGFVIRAPTYSLPERMVEHVSFVMKATHLPYDLERVGHRTEAKGKVFPWMGDQEVRRHLLANPTKLPTLAPTSLPTLVPTSEPTIDCGCVKPYILWDFYNISSTKAPNASCGVYESLGQYGRSDDLLTFQDYFGLPQTRFDKVRGGFYGTSRSADSEANLDVQYLSAIAGGSSQVQMWYWYSPTNSSFSDWLVDVANSADFPEIFSISYTAYEIGISKKDLELFTTEAVKLAARGVTLLSASGDDGVSGYILRDYTNVTGEMDNPKPFCRDYGYSPQWPATSPYVVAVGGTQGPEVGQKEIGCSSLTGCVITSGGGFSDKFSRPSFQDDFISGNSRNGYTGYLKTSEGKAAKAGFAAGGRGYPDVSMLAINYLIVEDGDFYAECGTSASTPVFAGALTLLNSKRKLNGLSSIGWATPQLYKMYQKWGDKIFNDVTAGENSCAATQYPEVAACCKEGFNATKGWDPVTGLGSVNVGRMLQYMSTYTFADDDYTNTFDDADDYLINQAPLGTLIFFMILFFIILAVCLCCAMCMSGRISFCSCCTPCLVNTVGCKALEDCVFGKKKISAAEHSDWFPTYFGWVSPLAPAGSEMYIVQLQTGLLCWKRITENLRNMVATVNYFLLPIVFLASIKILILVLNGFTNGAKSSGILELLFCPFMYIAAVQLTTVSLVEEKCSKLRESMRIMGLRETSYWLSYILVDVVIMGFLLSFFMCVWAAMLGLFYNVGQGHGGKGDGSFGELLQLLYSSVFAFSAVGFALSTVLPNSQLAGTAVFLYICGAFVLFFVLLFSVPDAFDTAASQRTWCLFPPIALQMGLLAKFNAFPLINVKISIGTISGMLMLDFGLLCLFAWYLGQVMPSEFGVQRKPWFLLMPSYWLGSDEPSVISSSKENFENLNPIVPGQLGAQKVDGASYPAEAADPSVVGQATVSVKDMKKSFGAFKAVNGLSFDLYEGQIFSLLGHNGAGKTTTINMLTGLLAPDWDSGNSSVYNADLQTNLAEVRKTIGVCPQHDLLFNHLTAREHIIFYSLLKGTVSWNRAAAEAEDLLTHFHLTERRNHLGVELSGGMKRKVSTAVALCGGSKFVILDEPTAGMDPLARRELWDLLKEMRVGRTMLLTTHYMDEADVLGDRIGIMSRGELQCLGSSSFLKHNFGTGYKLICTVEHGALATKHSTGGTEDSADNGGSNIAMTNIGSSRLESNELVQRILKYLQNFVEEASFSQAESSAATLVFVLPFAAVSKFKALFTSFDNEHQHLKIVGYGVSITNLEEVFLQVGGDHDLEKFEAAATSSETGKAAPANVEAVDETVGFMRHQIYGLWWKRLIIAKHDPWRTGPLLLLPMGGTIAMFALNYSGLFKTGSTSKVGGESANILTCLISSLFYMPAVSLLAEGVVTERVLRLRNILTVMGCDMKSYWLGTLAGDYTLLMMANVPAFFGILIITQLSDPGDDWKDDEPLQPFVNGARILWVFIFSAFHLCGFSYVLSHGFNSSASAIVFASFLCLALLFVPLFLTFIIYNGFVTAGFMGVGYVGFSNNLLRLLAVLSPHAMLAEGLLASSDLCANYGYNQYDGFYSTCALMPYWAYLVLMALEGALYLYAAYRIDLKTIESVPEQIAAMNELTIQQLDDDVRQERQHILDTPPAEFALHINGLRRLFDGKKPGQPPLQAVKNLNLGIARGEIFGLLGANGAGKTTAISMISRALLPTAGNVHIEGHSVLHDFQAGAKHLGIVAQHNTLWEKLSCRDHLRLFARLRGTDVAQTEDVVNNLIHDLELGPYADRLAGQLSGGMKRKLCVAISIIGDPQVVMLDEPSAGLDPVSRRNLWDTLIKTMAKRAVILTTHSMEEAEALCTRIGIMVKGQLRAIGEPQHLKHKFGSGYEIIVQLKPGNIGDDTSARAKRVTDFIVGQFNGSSLLSENGGLLTYRLEDNLKVGLTFDILERAREEFEISDYTVAQPTLEQVFIRTVFEYSGGERQNMLAGSSHPEQSPWVRPTLGSEGEAFHEAALVKSMSTNDDGGFNRPSALKPTRSSLNGQSIDAAEMRGSMMLDGDNNNTRTGVKDTWLGLDRRSHRALCCGTGWFIVILYIMIQVGLGYSIFPLILALLMCVISCVGCCCAIPNAEADDDD